MHLAALAGTPVVGIFGPTDPVENAPSLSVPHRIVRQDVGCNPCREGCPARACMRAVEPKGVLEAALALL
jgi:ADP-heptose:LPS heptosyltransferase